MPDWTAAMARRRAAASAARLSALCALLLVATTQASRLTPQVRVCSPGPTICYIPVRTEQQRPHMFALPACFGVGAAARLCGGQAFEGPSCLFVACAQAMPSIHQINAMTEEATLTSSATRQREWLGADERPSPCHPGTFFRAYASLILPARSFRSQMRS